MTAGLARCDASLAAVAAELSERLAWPPPASAGEDCWRHQSLSRGAAGVAIVHGTRALGGHGRMDRADTWLRLAACGGLSTGPGSGLWFGAPAVAFAVQVAAPGRYPAAVRALRQAVAGMTQSRLRAADERIAAAARPSLSEFDLVRGLAGLGAYYLHCEPGHELLRQILRYLARLTEPVPAGDAAGVRAPGWWSDDNPAAGTDAAGGHANLGMAHGIAGPLALLALATREGITVSGQDEAIDRICAWLDAWKQPGPWWPYWITFPGLRDGHPAQAGPGRPSWCYGTPGLARAQQLAGIARHNAARQAAAEDALARSVGDPEQAARLTGPGLCHGWSGTAITAWHAAQDASGTQLASMTASSARNVAESARGDHPIGLMNGQAGAALTLHAIATGKPGTWPGCLLIT